MDAFSHKRKNADRLFFMFLFTEKNINRHFPPIFAFSLAAFKDLSMGF